MNILVPDSWLREYLKTDATPKQLKDCLSLCGPSIERIHTVGNDTVYDIEITSNRVDMASIYGIAREAAAILPRFGIQATLKPIPSATASERAHDAHLPLKIEDPHNLCDRLVAVVMENVTVKPSPDFIRDRIEKSGIRSLNNLVDITNYVMLELGHPCHVFDYDRIKTNTFIIRNAKKGERIVTLDKKEYRLSDEDIIIDDGTGRVVDLPGIMGTENSVVTDSTKRIIFFIESNNPVAIRKSSMRYGIRTYAATINEKHPDPELTKTALMRAVGLCRDVAGGTVAGETIDMYPNPSRPAQITVPVDFINERLGVHLKEKEIVEILTSLSFDVVAHHDAPLQITPPSFRQFDVTIAEDIVEEIARLYGYYKLPGKLMTGEIPVTDKPKDYPMEEKIKQALKYWGYTEVYTYSFISKDLIEKAGLSIKDHLKVANPLTVETGYMRRSLLPSMLQTIEKNQYYQQNLSLFELANVYIPGKNDLPEEKGILMMVKTSSYRELKGHVELLLEEIGITDWNIEHHHHGYFYPNKSAQLSKNGRPLGIIGSIHPEIIGRFGIKQEIFVAALWIGELLALASRSRQYVSISPYPTVEEDFTLIIPEKTGVGHVIDVLKGVDIKIKDVTLKDMYENTITIQVAYHDPDRNLSSEDTQKVRTKILMTLKNTFDIELKS